MDRMRQMFRMDIIVSTVSLSMGLDCSRISGVLHYNFPVSVESYVQQIGRSGRSGQDSACVTFLSRRDFFFFRNMTLLDHFSTSLTLHRLVDFVGLLPRMFTKKYDFKNRNGPNLTKPQLGNFRPLNQYFVILEEAAKKRFLLKKEQMLILLSLLEKHGRTGGYFMRLVFTLCVNIKIAFRSKAEGQDSIKKDPMFKRISKLARTKKNGFSFNVCAVANFLKMDPLNVVADFEEMALKHSAFCIKSGYGIYIKIEPKNKDYLKSPKLRLETHLRLNQEMFNSLKKSNLQNLKRHLRRVDLFYYIIDQAIDNYADPEARSDFVQASIKKYFESNEIEYIENEIGFENVKHSLPIEFVFPKSRLLVLEPVF